VNVQRQGEHPYCGPNKGLEKMSGFTYLPEAFTTEGIRVRQSGWKDMNVPDSINFMVDVVKDMSFTVHEEHRKVLVHCHAGYGRTGIVLACYLLYTTTKSAEEVVQIVRSKRIQCIQKNSQMAYIKKFQECKQSVYNCLDLIRAREVFTDQKHDCDFFIKHQLDLIQQSDSHRFYHIPRLVIVVFDRLNYLIDDKEHDLMTIFQCLNGNHEWKDNYEQILASMKLSINKGIWSCIDEMDDILVLIELLYDWLDDSVNYIVNTSNLIYIFKNNFEKELKSMICNRKNYTIETRKLIIDKFKNELKMSEFECLSCVAYFISHLLPEDDDEQCVINEFNLMLDKISTYLLGYNIDMVYENVNDFEAQMYKKYVEQLKNMIHIFAIVCKYDWTEPSRRKGSLSLMSNYLRRLYSSNEEYEIISMHKSNPDLLLKLKTQRNLDEVLKKDKGTKKEYLYTIYKSLHEYFEDKGENGNIPSKGVGGGGGLFNNNNIDDSDEKFEEFLGNFMDFIEITKKSPSLKNHSRHISPNTSRKHSRRSSRNGSRKSGAFVSVSPKVNSPKSIKSILKQKVDSSVHEQLLKRDSTSFALSLKNDKSRETINNFESTFEVRNLNIKPSTSKLKRIQFDSHKDVISYLNNCGSEKSDNNSGINERPKARKRLKFNSTSKFLPKMYGYIILPFRDYEIKIEKDRIIKTSIINSELGGN
jgi:hypothetical protein